MGFVVGDRVNETTTTTGTGDITLAGAVTGFRAFSAIAVNGDVVAYAIVGGAEWEIGIGTWVTGNTLQRTKVLESSNAGALVSFSAGTKNVFCTLPSQHANAGVISRVLRDYLYLPSGAYMGLAGTYEIAAGVTLELAADATLEVG